mmetsp:Transcript_36287/g.91395  ORF Transcript_36287/g.91395 Transcript_36287/m.91395 type:complete len:256 (-) Transcript_36287:3-770(-)
MHACECVRRLVQPSGTSWLDDRLLRGDNLPAERALLQDLGRATVAQHVAARDQARCHAFILAKAAIDSVVALDWHSNLDNACCLDWQSNWDRAFCIGSCCTMDCVGTTSARHTMEGLHIFCTGRRCTMVALDCANRLPFGADHKGPLWKSHVLNIHSREAQVSQAQLHLRLDMHFFLVRHVLDTLLVLCRSLAIPTCLRASESHLVDNFSCLCFPGIACFATHFGGKGHLLQYGTGSTNMVGANTSTKVACASVP